MKILIVDDDNVSSTLVARILQKNNYRTLVLNSAEKAIECLETGAPVGLIILDMVMPDMDGSKFMEYINNRPGMKNIPVIICSGDVLQVTESNAITIGAKFFLGKPIDGRILIEKIEQVLKSDPQILIDRKTVMSRLNINEPSYKEMLSLLIKSGTKAIKDIHELIKSEDLDKLHCVVVGLKGGAISLGAGRLADVLNSMEFIVKVKNMETIQEMSNAIHREINILADMF